MKPRKATSNGVCDKAICIIHIKYVHITHRRNPNYMTVAHLIPGVTGYIGSGVKLLMRESCFLKITRKLILEVL